MIPIGDRPILLHIMEAFARHGFKEFVLCLGYKGEMIREYFLNFLAMTCDFTVDLTTGIVETQGGPKFDWKVTLVDTGLPTGTGGRIKRVEQYLGKETFFMTYGDGLSDVDIAALLDHHRRMGLLATVTGMEGTSRFGVIESTDNGIVSGFKEKPRLEGMVSGGFFVFEPGIMNYLDENCTLETTPLETLAKNEQLTLFSHRGFFKSMDTYRDYLLLNEMYKAGNTPWIVNETD